MLCPHFLVLSTDEISNIIVGLRELTFFITVRPRFWQLVGAVKTCCQNPTMRAKFLRTQELILWVNCLLKYDIFIFN
jgi:hypothetical protein